MDRRMKILVTGGAGFIASHIVDAYIQHGHEVVVLDDLSSGKRENVNPSATFIHGKIEDSLLLSKIKEDHGEFDIINHHAAQMSVAYSVRNPKTDAETNIFGIINLLEIFGPSCKKFIFSSSGGTVYGDHSLPRVEEDKTDPLSPYGITKLAGEKYINYYSTRFGFESLILRYANVYGPRQNPHGEAGVVAIFIKKILAGEEAVINGDGMYLRDYVHVNDVVNANVIGITPGVKGVYNVSTGVTLDVNEIWEEISTNQLLENYTKNMRHGEHRDGDIRYSCCIPGDIHEWKPNIMFHDGISDTILWFIENN
jgi:UDP-glucose 4-epimerase